MKSLLFSFFLTFSFSAFSSDFNAFQKLLDGNLVVSELPDGGFQTAFDYEKAFKNPQTKEWIQKQETELSKIDLSSLSSKNKANAFWINAYNFFMVKIVLEKGFKDGKLDIKSVKDFGNFINRYKIFGEEINNVGGKKMSLDQIEKGTLLSKDYKDKGWKDARIHFAVNCASVGCPPLTQSIYTAETLDSALDSNIRKAFKTKRHLTFKGHDLHLTHLFKWYEKDFVEASGSVKKFILQYVEEPNVRKSVQNADGIEFIEYDWRLNKPANFK